MSSLRLRVTAPAREDIHEILDYARREWGTQQRARTRLRLDEAFERIKQYPGIGRERPDIGASVRSLAIRPYVILYRQEEQALFILRVMHERQEVSNELAEIDTS